MSNEQQVVAKIASILAQRNKVPDFMKLPDGKTRKIVILKVKLVATKIEQVGSSFYKVTLVNEGNASAYSGRCDLYSQSLTNVLTLRQSLGFVLHPGQTRTLDFTAYRPTGESVHAFAYDPVADAFPMFSMNAFAVNQKNLVLNGTNPAHGQKIPATWKQFDKISGTFTAVTEANKTWQGIDKEASDPDTRLRSYFKAYATAGAESQLVQDISLISPALDARMVTEINKGNVSYTAAALLSVYDQTPTDEADFLLQLTGGTLQETGYKKHLNWVEYILSGIVPKNPNKATLMLRSKRNAGSNNDGFFANITFRLKHRQIASLVKSTTATAV